MINRTFRRSMSLGILTALTGGWMAGGWVSSAQAAVDPTQCGSQPITGTVTISKVTSVEQRTNDLGNDYLVVRGAGTTTGNQSKELSISFFSNVAETCNTSGCGTAQKRRLHMSAICMDSARQAMATGKAFYIYEGEGTVGQLTSGDDAQGIYGAAGSCAVSVRARAGNALLPPQRCGVR